MKKIALALVTLIAFSTVAACGDNLPPPKKPGETATK